MVIFQIHCDLYADSNDDSSGSLSNNLQIQIPTFQCSLSSDTFTASCGSSTDSSLCTICNNTNEIMPKPLLTIEQAEEWIDTDARPTNINDILVYSFDKFDGVSNELCYCDDTMDTTDDCGGMLLSQYVHNPDIGIWRFDIDNEWSDESDDDDTISLSNFSMLSFDRSEDLTL